MQVVMFPLDAHWLVQVPEQLPSQLPWHDASQSKLPGFAVQLAMQPPVQLGEQLADALAVHPPEQLSSSCPVHATSKLTGVHLAMQLTVASTSHISVPLPWKMAAPLQAESRSALAAPAAKVTTSGAPSATARSEDQRDMGRPP